MALGLQSGFIRAYYRIYRDVICKGLPIACSKSRKKGRTKAEPDEVTCRLTGHSIENLDELMKSDITYGDFFLKAPNLNPDRKLITGTICGVRVENIENPLMQEIRYLDKLADELAKGKALEKVIRKPK